ncbi:hypothetical protein PYW07_000131 [Mythimna separata]|uniref:Uncharacterized protein n=1 Tax=Mythimna separata TaxID=271217 RepID=A0AAD7Z3J6_MYTSE|nr:hypothetical protein PYW07_000131 [Mythimna separata]
MERLPMCRICLVENVRMYIVVGKHLHKVYELLTNIPFITEDRKPTLACYFCYSKLEQYYQLQEQCLEAEKLFNQMLNEPNASILRGKSILFNGLTKSPMETINIISDDLTSHVPIKEEGQDMVEPKEEFINVLAQPNLPIHRDQPVCSHSSSMDNITIIGDGLMNSIEIQVEIQDMSETNEEIECKDPLEIGDQEVFGKKRRASDATSTTATKKPKRGSLRKKLDEIFPYEQNENQIPVMNIVSKNVLDNLVFKEPPKCYVCQRGFIFKNILLKHIRTHTGEKPYTCHSCQRKYNSHDDLIKHMRKHNGEKPYKCGICQCSFNTKNHYTRHIRTHVGKKRY